MFQDKVVVITGGAGGIGKCIAEEFRKKGAHVCVIDCTEGDHYVGDIADQKVLEDFAHTVIERYGRVDVPVFLFRCYKRTARYIFSYTFSSVMFQNICSLEKMSDYGIFDLRNLSTGSGSGSLLYRLQFRYERPFLSGG